MLFQSLLKKYHFNCLSRVTRVGGTRSNVTGNALLAGCIQRKLFVDLDLVITVFDALG